MRWFVLHCAVLGLLTVVPQVRAETISSTFDTDDEGWRVVGDATSVVPQWSATEGNPDGHVYAVDQVVGGVWYWQAPAKFLGDVSGAYGLTLTFDLKQSGTHNQFNSNEVLLTGGGLTLAIDMAHPGTTWTSYSIPIDEAGGWGIGSENGPAPTQAQMVQVVASLEDLRIRGEFITGADTGSLDNVVLNVPEPSTLALVGIGALALVACACRRRSAGWDGPGDVAGVTPVSDGLPVWENQTFPGRLP